uniref:Uncharacterized protein n=1 Tax=Physcomitrium patens TaxID=3218 RepID=A0A2K1L9F5_PHYPA|nr:hypothetical protein PHYPA_001067 [Physcomitrium patens]
MEFMMKNGIEFTLENKITTCNTSPLDGESFCSGAPDRDFEMLHIQLQESRSGHDPEKGKDYPRQTKASLDLKPEQYLMWKDCSVDGCDLLCFSVEPEQQQQPEGEAAHQVATIGGFALQGFLVVMDAEQDQFGWARSSCDDEEYKFHYSF